MVGLTKTCRECSTEKPATIEFFQPHSRAKPQYLRSYCRGCATAVHARWVEANRDTVRAHSRRSYAANRAKRISVESERQRRIRSDPTLGPVHAAKHRMWREIRLASPEKVEQERARWRRAALSAAGKARALRCDHLRRARKLSAPGEFSAEEFAEVVAAQDGRCFYCCEEMTIPTADHMTPLSRGGSNSIENIVAACKSCNCRKNNRTLAEYLAVLGDKAPEHTV
jgi:5-methylcytosine-specific restriction endonuclease McrA